MGEALIRLSLRVYRLEVEALEGLAVPLSIRQYHILDRVDRHIISMTELAALARRQLATISTSVSSLVRQDLLVRRPSPTDRRVVLLALTEAGDKVLAEARAARASLASFIGASLDLDLEPGEIEAVAAAFYDRSEAKLRRAAEASGAERS